MDRSQSLARTRLLSLLLGILILAPSMHTTALAEERLVAFLVRHGEKIDESPETELSTAGRMRAAQLALILRDADIEHIHSTDTRRTMSTAEPTATELGRDVEQYDGNELEDFAKRIKKVGGRHLIVGHSNTTLKVVGFLGGKPGAAINEKREFDRLYVIVIGTDGRTSTTLLRYGAAYGK